MIWEEWQLDMLRDTYPDHGGTPVAKATGRKRTAVQQKARKLGLEKKTPAGSKYDYSGIDDQLKRIYAKRSLGALKKLADKCGIPIGSLKYRARIHLRLPPMIAVDRHNRPWEDREIDILETYGERSIEVISKRLAMAGYPRSPQAIQCQLSNMQIRMTRVDLISSSEFARKMGYDNSVPLAWIARGLLKAKRELMNARSISIKDSYCWISRKAARNFLVNHPAAYDHRRITDWLWVLDLLTNQAIGAEAVSDTCGKGDGPEFSVSEAA